jgi:uncharacterized delta-60 repeat protein
MHVMRRRLIAIGVATAFLSLPALVFAGRAGSPDDSFGGDGKVLIRELTGYANAVSVGNHGRIVAVGFGGNRFAPGADFALTRLRPNGHLDRSFSHDGKQETTFGNLSRAQALAIGPRGGVVAAGVTCEAKLLCDSAAVVRYSRDGHIKRSFGDRGKVRIRFGSGENFASAVAIDQHQFLIGGGNCPTTRPGCEIGIARLSRDGTLDRSFGNGGKVVTDFDSDPAPGGCPDSVGVAGMHVASPLRIVVAGTCNNGDVALAQFEWSGDPDISFGNDGKLRMNLGFENGATDLAIDSRHRLDVAGTIGHSGFDMARFLPGGELDRSFGKNGIASTERHGSADRIGIDSRGRIVRGGSFGGKFNAVRFEPSGRVDRSFGFKGKAVAGKNWGYGALPAMALDSHDRVLGAGFKKRRFAFVRLLG